MKYRLIYMYGIFNVGNHRLLQLRLFINERFLLLFLIKCKLISLFKLGTETSILLSRCVLQTQNLAH